MESFATKSNAEFLRMLRVREAVDDPALVLMEDAVMPLAHREVEAEGVHEPTMRASAIGRRDSDLVWPATIDRGGGKLPFLRPTDLPHLTLCSSYVLMAPLGSPDVNASERSKNRKPRRTPA